MPIGFFTYTLDTDNWVLNVYEVDEYQSIKPILVTTIINCYGSDTWDKLINWSKTIDYLLVYIWDDQELEYIKL